MCEAGQDESRWINLISSQDLAYVKSNLEAKRSEECRLSTCSAVNVGL